MSLAEQLVEAWYAPRLKLGLMPLLPLAAAFGLAVRLRRTAYQRGCLASKRLAVPVCVVGNITLGGTGKTPLVLALAQALAARSWRPGLLTRGYGARVNAPRPARSSDCADDVGDEALLLAESGFPVWVGADRAAAGTALLKEHPECSVLIADDGLQHYRLHRDAEVLLIDAQRGLGNGRLLPAGPLREPASRLSSVSAVVWHESMSSKSVAEERWTMRLQGETFVQLASPENRAGAAAFAGKKLVAVAGLGHPQRFFSSLTALGLKFEARAFPDHHAYRPEDLAFPDAEVILMSAKDAVKCRGFADARMWFLPVRAALPEGLVELIEEKLRGSQIA